MRALRLHPSIIVNVDLQMCGVSSDAASHNTPMSDETVHRDCKCCSAHWLLQVSSTLRGIHNKLPIDCQRLLGKCLNCLQQKLFVCVQNIWLTFGRGSLFLGGHYPCVSWSVNRISFRPKLTQRLIVCVCLFSLFSIRFVLTSSIACLDNTNLRNNIDFQLEKLGRKFLNNMPPVCYLL